MLLKLQLHLTQLHHQHIQEEPIQAQHPPQLRSQALLTLLQPIQGRLHHPIRGQDKPIQEQPHRLLDKAIREQPHLLLLQDKLIREQPHRLLDKPIREQPLLLLQDKAIREQPLLLLQDKAIQDRPLLLQDRPIQEPHHLLKAIQEPLLPILELLEGSLILPLPLEILTAAAASQDTPIQLSLTTKG